MNFPAQHFASAGAITFSPMQQTLRENKYVFYMHAFLHLYRRGQVTGLIVTDGLQHWPISRKDGVSYLYKISLRREELQLVSQSSMFWFGFLCLHKASPNSELNFVLHTNVAIT